MTIKEMALKAYPINMLGDGDCSLDLAKIPRRAYIEGAKAVLEEIERALKQAKLYSDLSCKSRLYDDLVNLVEQLKK
jgi:hypothetical protein